MRDLKLRLQQTVTQIQFELILAEEPDLELVICVQI